MPARMSARIVSGLSLAGPSVQRIFVRVSLGMNRGR